MSIDEHAREVQANAGGVDKLAEPLSRLA
jgi:hypothetical protein